MASESKLQEELGEDRISQMPDEILLHILSLLQDTILSVVEATILSKRWKNLWTSVSTLRFDDRFFIIREDDRFMTVVDRMVSLHDSTDIRKFSLDYSHYSPADDFNRICRCISTVLEHNVAEIDLRIMSNDRKSLLCIAERFFMCTTLVVLKVESNCISFSDLPTAGCFPSLKVLCITVRNPYDDDSYQELLTCCPKLEDLTFVWLNGSHFRWIDRIINITAPKLKTLRIHVELSDRPAPEYFSINAPKLENFEVDDFFSTSSYFIQSGKSLIRGKITLHQFGFYSAELFAKLYNVECLSLDVYNLNVSCLPEFVNLGRLVLCVSAYSSTKLLIECLERCPNLKHLVFEFASNKSHHHEWTDPPEPPACLVSHLQTVSILRFKGRHDEMTAAKFFLRNGEVLKTMNIQLVSVWPTCRYLYTKEELYKELLKFDETSKCLINVELIG